MNANQLKVLAEQILLDFQKALNDLLTISGYMYEKKTTERMERLYDVEIKKIIHNRLKKFEEEYIARLNFLTDQASKEMRSPILDKEALSAKINFWNAIYRDKPIDFLIRKYQEALDTRNSAFIFFVENQLMQLTPSVFRKGQLKKLIQKNRKSRITSGVQIEIKQLNHLYGFYVQSREFSKQHGFSLSGIQKLFHSLNLHFQTPLQELQIFKKV